MIKWKVNVLLNQYAPYSFDGFEMEYFEEIEKDGKH